VNGIGSSEAIAIVFETGLRISLSEAAKPLFTLAGIQELYPATGLSQTAPVSSLRATASFIGDFRSFFSI
jgi:hypothetical protein